MAQQSGIAAQAMTRIAVISRAFLLRIN